MGSAKAAVYEINEPGYETPVPRKLHDYDAQYATSNHAIVIDNGLFLILSTRCMCLVC